MRKLIIALALTTTVLASPAVARDGSPYAGLDFGALIVEDRPPFELTFDDEAPIEFTVDHKRGYDIGAFAGYDLGMVKVEGELAYKRATVKAVTIGSGDYNLADGRSTALSAMVNGLLDFESDRWNGFVGPGVGIARVSERLESEDLDAEFSDSDVALAWQITAGVRYAVTQNMDVGLKYRFFNAPKLRYDVDGGELEDEWRSHSIMASLAYNFYTPPVVVAPPPPVVVEQAPPPPATQTCPDGSVILATDVCPPPPPPPPGERG